jgi:DNA-binding MarR family transcriptional regulator
MQANKRQSALSAKDELVHQIIGHLMHRYSTAVVLLHHAVAEHLEIGPTDLQCLDLLRERGAMAGSDLAALTGLTTGAITGVVTRLERAGYLHREPDPHDARKQKLRPSLERTQGIHHVFEPILKDLAAILEGFDSHQLSAIANFLQHTTDIAYRHLTLLRSDLWGQQSSGPDFHTQPSSRRSTRKRT